MMFYGYDQMGGSYGLHLFLAWVTWILVVVALILLIVWLWKQINKEK